MEIKKEKICIDFFGLNASGKSTIKRKLSKKIEEKGFKVCYYKKSKIDFLKILIFFFISSRPYNLLLKWGKHKKKYKNIIISRKKFLLYNYFFYVKKCRFFIWESTFIVEGINLGFFKEYNDKDLWDILNFLPGKRRFLIFVDTPPEVAYKRKIERKDNKKRVKYDLNFFKNAYNENHRFYNVVVRNKDKDTKIIKVNGLRPVEENVRIIMKEIRNEK